MGHSVGPEGKECSGCVVAAHAVVRGEVPEYSVVGGIPARVLKDRRQAYAEDEQRRAAIADIARKTDRAARQQAGIGGSAGSVLNDPGS